MAPPDFPLPEFFHSFGGERGALREYENIHEGRDLRSRLRAAGLGNAPYIFATVFIADVFVELKKGRPLVINRQRATRNEERVLVELEKDRLLVEFPLNPRVPLGSDALLGSGDGVPQGGDPGAEGAAVGGGPLGDGPQQGLQFPLGDGEEMGIIHFAQRIFDIPGDGEKTLEIRRDLELLEFAVVPLHEILEVGDRRSIEGPVGKAEKLMIRHHLGDFLDHPDVLLLVLLQGQPEIFFRLPDFREVAV